MIIVFVAENSLIGTIIQYSNGNYITLLHSTAGGTTTARGSRSTVGNG